MTEKKTIGSVSSEYGLRTVQLYVKFSVGRHNFKTNAYVILDIVNHYLSKEMANLYGTLPERHSKQPHVQSEEKN